MDQWKMNKEDYIARIENGERRVITHKVEYREEGDEGKIEGIASRVNEWYDLGYFEERIAKGAFDDVMKDDVRALFNHDPNLVLARTKSQTLELFKDKEGHLAYRYKTPNRSYAKDLEDAVKSGDVDQSSFAFRVAEESWEWRDDNDKLKKDRRTISKVEKLYDVSPVTYPASPSTTVAARKVDDHKSDLESAKKIRNQNKLKLAKAKLTLINLK
jgi:HK97 family phage prohead protease